MSTKITVSLVAEVLKKHKTISPATLREVIEELNHVTQPEETDEPVPRQKTQYVCLQTEPSTAWIVQIAETDGPHSVFDRINEAAHAFNATKKGRLIPVKLVSEALETVKRKQLKEAGILKVCTKLPVAVITGLNKLTPPPTA